MLKHHVKLNALQNHYVRLNVFPIVKTALKKKCLECNKGRFIVHDKILCDVKCPSIVSSATCKEENILNDKALGDCKFQKMHRQDMFRMPCRFRFKCRKRM